MSTISDELYERFKTSLEATDGSCTRAATKDLGGVIAELYKAYGAKDACVCEGPLIKEAGLVDALKEAGMTVYTDHIRLHGETAKGGLSEVQAGIAELGTIMQIGDDVDARITATMTEYYIGVVRGSTIVETYDDMFDQLSEMDPFPSFVGFISGPSRTADIECVGTVGVHGPLKVTVVVVDDE